MKVSTGAKVNLWLRIHPARRDGFHPIETVFQSVSLNDQVEVTRIGEAVTEVTMRAEGDGPVELPEPKDNIVTKAIGVLREATGDRTGLSVTIAKRIPLAAGLAGGSGNAAGLLVAATELLDLGLDASEMIRLAARVGSDVPFCLWGGTVGASGRGEVLRRLDDLDAWFVLGISNRGLATSEVYARWDLEGRTGGTGPEEIEAAISSRTLSRVAAAMANDLEPVVMAMRPELLEARESLEEAGALKAMVSGSGPTILALCGSQLQAVDVAARVAGRFDRVEVVRSTPRLVETVRGDARGSV